MTTGNSAADARGTDEPVIGPAGRPADDEVESAAASRGPLAMEAIAVSKDFRARHGTSIHAVRAVSFSLYRGGVVALVGESGSGKSTIARLLAGQEKLSSGSVRLDGEPVTLHTRRGFRRYKSSVQLVFQDPFSSLNPVHTVRYHIERPVRLHQRTTSAAKVGEEVASLLRQVRLVPPEQFVGKYPHELSGGQRQRVAFARALAARPEVLLADEPVSMLDVSIRLEILNLLDDLRQRFQLAMLYITHDIASARYFADEVLVLYAGQVVERGPAEDVTQHPAHPYTQLLVASAPDPDRFGSTLREGARSAAREQAAAMTTADGCPFSPRCPFAVDHCRTHAPALQRIDTNRAAACWRLDVAAPDVLAGRQGGGNLTA
ncbi:MAG TPA: ABC transporter ATP-binding protein [Streptosporangiaceae bacterium]|nr:ABC transporter ATP-binding protein [Streptosporangiaceae bacterium]